MVMRICPRCNREYSVGAHDVDFVHECDSGNPALDNEDKVVLSVTAQDGDKEINTGRLQSDINYQGIANKLTGIGKICGGKVYDYTKRGNRESTTRVQKADKYIDLKTDKCGGN